LPHQHTFVYNIDLRFCRECFSELTLIGYKPWLEISNTDQHVHFADIDNQISD